MLDSLSYLCTFDYLIFLILSLNFIKKFCWIKKLNNLIEDSSLVFIGEINKLS